MWIGLASTTATLLCGAVVLGMLHYASPGPRQESLAGVIAVMAAPSGSDLNPARLDRYIRVPSVPEDGLIQAALERPVRDGEMVLALSATVTREGKVEGVSVLTNDRQGGDVGQILDAISRSKLEPARYGEDPVAVNLVWLVAHTTVKPRASI